jgi:catechol 2,3-dioxygenase-like lactoylglutathione lyase family enzyme
MSVKFAPGRNMAMKVPPHQYEATIQFYRDIVGLKPIEKNPPEVGFHFGDKQLWIDRVSTLSQAEIWLELVTDNVAAAAQALAAADVVRCDAIEPLPEGFAAFWIANPASIIHLVCQDEGSL